MNDDICISVVVATRNRTSLLVEAVESLNRQNYDGFEVLIVDDGSSAEILDHHRRLVERLGKRFRLLEPSAPACRGSGPSGARNRGASQAQGEFLAFLDDDDLWIDPAFLSVASRVLKTQNCDLFFADMIGIRNGQQIKPPWAVLPSEAATSIRLKQGETTEVPPSNLYDIAKKRIIHPGQCVVRRTIFQQCGGFFEGLWSNSEDRNLMLRLLDVTQNVYYYHKPVLQYRLPVGDSISCSEAELYHILQRIMSAQHARLVCRNSKIRSAARAGESWSYREAATYHASQGNIFESIVSAMQGVVVYPRIGSCSFCMQTIASAAMKIVRDGV